MDYHTEFILAAHILLAAFLGALIGLERERHVGLAGIRTHATVALGACLFGFISMNVKDIISKSDILLIVSSLYNRQNPRIPVPLPQSNTDNIFLCRFSDRVNKYPLILKVNSSVSR